ncbi:MAG: OmpH family outer membrane protein, partial [Pseudomonadota bacterium]
MVTLVLSVPVSAQTAELKVGYVQVDKILQDAPQTAESG